MKKVLTLLFLIHISFLAGQNKEDINLIDIDSTWGKEIIKVPFWFAPKISYQGFEDIRFAKGWENINSNGFWTLVFAWDINLKTKPTQQFFEENLKLYFDGLMKVVNENEKLKIPKTEANFKKTKSNKGVEYFKGVVKTYDAFTTKKIILLNVTIESYYCKKMKRYMPLFRFSPRDYNHKAWKMLKQAKLKTNICN